MCVMLLVKVERNRYDRIDQELMARTTVNGIPVSARKPENVAKNDTFPRHRNS